MLYRFLSLVKNVRGVVAFASDEGLRRFDELSRKYRYRNLGVPKTIAQKFGLGSKGKVITLDYPLSKCEEFVRRLSDALGVEYEALEPIALASYYVTTVIVLDDVFWSEASKLFTKVIRTQKNELNWNDIRLHIRIAEYTVIDFYRWAVEDAELRLRARATDVGERLSRIEKDVKRYWRLLGEEGRDVLAYDDMGAHVMRLVAEGRLSECEVLAEENLPLLTIISLFKPW